MGVTLDSRLNFALHTREVCSKLSKTLGIIYRLREIVPQDILLKLYYSLFYPHLSYCNRIWGSTYDLHLQPLFILQKKCVRIIAGAHYTAHTSPLFKKFNILNIFDVHKFIVGQAMYKMLSIGLFASGSHPHFTRRREQISHSFQRLTVTQRSIDFEGPKIWNSIPASIRNLQSLCKFKSSYKRYLLSSYDCEWFF